MRLTKHLSIFCKFGDNVEHILCFHNLKNKDVTWNRMKSRQANAASTPPGPQGVVHFPRMSALFEERKEKKNFCNTEGNKGIPIRKEFLKTGMDYSLDCLSLYVLTLKKGPHVSEFCIIEEEYKINVTDNNSLCLTRLDEPEATEGTAVSRAPRGLFSRRLAGRRITQPKGRTAG